MSPRSTAQVLLIALVGVTVVLLVVGPSFDTTGQDELLLTLALTTLGAVGAAIVLAVRLLQPREIEGEAPPSPISDEMIGVLFLARQEAEQDGHAAITDLHLLRGLLRTRGSVAEAILTRAGVSFERLPAPAAQPAAIDDVAPGQVPLSVNARGCLMAARDEARQLGHGQLHTGHVLLALLRSDVSAVAVILHTAGIDRLTVLAVMAHAA